MSEPPFAPFHLKFQNAQMHDLSPSSFIPASSKASFEEHFLPITSNTSCKTLFCARPKRRNHHRPARFLSLPPSLLQNPRRRRENWRFQRRIRTESARHRWRYGRPEVQSRSEPSHGPCRHGRRRLAISPIDFSTRFEVAG